MKRAVSCIFVVNPPGLGKKRRKVFEKQFETWPKRPPPIFYRGINKNYMDLRDGSKYRRMIIDDRSRWVRLKLRLGLERHARNFRQKHDPMLRQTDRVTQPVEIGRVANAFSHIEIWKQCRHFSDDEVCMIVEDDALINPEIEFDGIEWPETADFLHLWPGSISFYENYCDNYVKIVKKWTHQKCNYMSIGYIITPACARRFLSELVPYVVGRTIDMEILYRGASHAFAVKRPWVFPIYGASLVAQPPRLYRLARAICYRLRFLFPYSFRKRHPFLVQDINKPQRFDKPCLE